MTTDAQTRCAVITGAAGGIGQALVRAFTAAGYKVVAVDRHPRPEGLDCAHYIVLDLAATVTDEAMAAQAFDKIRAACAGGVLQALIHNAALQVMGGAASLTRADWRSTLDVNLLAPFFMTQALLPDLELAKGCVVNISSIHARLTKQGFVAYATSKAALSGLTRALAVDLQGRVRVHAIEPAAIGTDMLKAGFDGQPEAFARLETLHPAGRIGTPEEVAATALWLVSASPGFLHGACIPLDGGIGNCLLDPG
jgi:NAD(P)-dependent dehydrogenase (short-subunit alcohol dehydrogenase family)